MVLFNDTLYTRRPWMASFTCTANKLKSRIAGSNSALHSVFDEATIHRLATEVGHTWRNCYWRPGIVVLTFLRQVLLPDCSCRRAVVMTTLLSQSSGRSVSDDPSAYSQSRQALPLELLQRLSGHLVHRFDESHRLWHGHRVRIVDGSGVSMPDTSELQRRFPQSNSQKPGCGFPTARIVGLFCWATGALLEVVYDALSVGELRLFRRLIEHIQRDDVVVADRHFGTYCEVALLARRGAHAVFRVHNARRINLRAGQRLGCRDRLQVWTRPAQCPMGMTPEQWAEIPETLIVRIVRTLTPDRRGHRRRKLDLVTTLLDSARYPAADLAELYADRWLVEVSLRSLKISQGMDVLRCKSVAMVEKELVMHQIAYNAIRLMMREAATRHGADLHRLSFAGTQQRLAAALLYAHPPSSGEALAALWDDLLDRIAADPIPHRPNRKEPRALKRRHKVYPYLQHPRDKARKMACYDSTN
jgi:hypothetical protein